MLPTGFLTVWAGGQRPLSAQGFQLFKSFNSSVTFTFAPSYRHYLLLHHQGIPRLQGPWALWLPRAPPTAASWPSSGLPVLSSSHTYRLLPCSLHPWSTFWSSLDRSSHSTCWGKPYSPNYWGSSSLALHEGWCQSQDSTEGTTCCHQWPLWTWVEASRTPLRPWK